MHCRGQEGGEVPVAALRRGRSLHGQEELLRAQLDDTVEAFGSVLMGMRDSLPEMAFYMVGGLDSVREKADKMAAEAARMADLQKRATKH